MNIPSTILWILRVQVGVTLFLALLWGLFEGWNVFFSALSGGGIAVLANAVYAMYASCRTAADGAKKVYRSQLWAEVLKWSLTVTLFTLVFVHYHELAGLPFLLAYLSTHAVFWAALLRKD